MRGEYPPLPTADNWCGELPPRARRIQGQPLFPLRAIGTTSACAENTGQKDTERTPSWNYLRVRGEYCALVVRSFRLQELPPRARRIPHRHGHRLPTSGTTSACAENTRGGLFLVVHDWNYLRVRGEYRPSNNHSINSMELPPRARRIPGSPFGGGQNYGTTSACAENTSLRFTNLLQKRNYLRVRGEYPRQPWRRPGVAELPPRARRILVVIS